MNTLLRLSLCLLGLVALAQAQVLTVEPPNPGPEDEVTIIFDAAEGNQALKDYRGPVYAHTGLITGTPEAPSDWRYIQGNWGRTDPRVRMRYLGNHRYQLRFRIRDFYGLPAGENFLQMAFVFRDRSGELVARHADQGDIYYPPLRTASAPPEPLQALSQAQSMRACQSVHVLADSSLLLSDGQQSLRVRSFGPGILNLAYLPTGASDLPPSMAIIDAPSPLRPQSLNDSLIEWPLGDGFRVRLTRAPLRWALYHGDSLLLDDEKGFSYDATRRSSGLRLHLQPKERLYGLGNRALPLDRRGYRLDMYHEPAYGYQNGRSNLYLSLPYLQSSRGYGLLVDSYRRGYFDLGKREAEILEIGMTDTALSCFLLVGDPPLLAERLTQLTGRQPMPPRWALGYLQSRFGYQSQQQTEEVALLTREAGFPLDGLLLDLYWFGGENQMGTLRWAEGQWPDPKGMVERLGHLGVHVIPIIEPYVMQGLPEFDTLSERGWLGTHADGSAYVIEDFWAGPAALMDVFRPEMTHWVWQRLRPVLEMGVGGLWSDLVEPEKHPDDLRHVNGWAPAVHNAYALRWMEGLYQAHRRYFPEKRWFHLIRSGYLGMQRYAAFPWSGDVSRSWGGLQAQPSIMLGTGLCGVGYLHSDLGGFAGDASDAERYERWVQMGVFTPLMRVHGSVTDSLEPEPMYQSPQTQARVRAAIELRYRLMPYLYTLAWQNHQKGWPLARPLFFHYPDDPTLDRLHEQYLWGRDLMVVPVLTPGQRTQEVYVPAGIWYDWYQGRSVEGQQWGNYPLSREHLPLFARGGSVIALAQPARSLQAQTLDTLTLRWYLAQRESTYQSLLYWDDGETAEALLRNQHRLLRFQVEEAKQKATLQIAAEGAGSLTAEGTPRATLEIYGLSAPPRRVKVDRKKVDQKAWQWLPEPGCLRISLPRVADGLELKVRF
jgi:oligosaccharide 4-alpha-D-glucosyltransferase